MVEGNDKIWRDKSIFREKVSLAASQIASLSKTELEFALAYEVEPFSHIKAEEANIAWRELKEEDANIKSYEVAVLGRKSKSAIRGKGKRGEKRILSILAFFSLTALAGALFDYIRLDIRLEQLEHDVAERQELDDHISAVYSKASAFEAERERIHRERDESLQAQAKLGDLRSAYRISMDILASVCGGKTLVKSFASPEPYHIKLEAVSSSAESAADTMGVLAVKLGEKNWRIEPGEITVNPSSSTATFVCGFYFEGAVK